MARLRVCLEEVRTLHSDAERIVVSGDLVQLRNPGAYSILRAELEQMPTPYRLLVGNHDDRDALLEIFPEIEHIDGFIQSADDLDDASLLYLDTLARDGQHHGELCPARLRWTVIKSCPPTSDRSSFFNTIRRAASAFLRWIA